MQFCKDTHYALCKIFTILTMFIYMPTNEIKSTAGWWRSREMNLCLCSIESCDKEGPCGFITAPNSLIAFISFPTIKRLKRFNVSRLIIKLMSLFRNKLMRNCACASCSASSCFFFVCFFKLCDFKMRLLSRFERAAVMTWVWSQIILRPTTGHAL